MMKHKKIMIFFIAIFSFGLVIQQTEAKSNRAKRALKGGLFGGLVGGGIGAAAANSAGKGFGIGFGVGAITGALIGAATGEDEPLTKQEITDLQNKSAQKRREIQITQKEINRLHSMEYPNTGTLRRATRRLKRLERELTRIEKILREASVIE